MTSLDQHYTDPHRHNHNYHHYTRYYHEQSPAPYGHSVFNDAPPTLPAHHSPFDPERYYAELHQSNMFNQQVIHFLPYYK